MILLDTHIWVWWVQGDKHLMKNELNFLDFHSKEGIGVSVFSCWEVAMLNTRKRLEFSCPLDEWISTALNYPGVQLIDLTVEIAIESCCLPKGFHRDPADRILAATSRIMNSPLVTADEQILKYPYVKTLRPNDLENYTKIR